MSVRNRGSKTDSKPRMNGWLDDATLYETEDEWLVGRESRYDTCDEWLVG
jgi:hypothetical protein